NELEYIKSEDHYLELFVKNKKEVIRGTISEILLQLPPNFAQSHRSYIINKNYIVRRNTTNIVLKNNVVIPVSRKYKTGF
ncbi:MAG: LytTR family transcriptional regulator DNA-binding domain-containing protein, partial [Flavobacterium sp.]|nr:LytTR family transcriptional regulator DNA-binding domain-containing protein [Flavobacterium sp.]